MPYDKTLKIPDYFYSLTRNSETHYANEPPGVFDATRFLRNLPPWKKPQTSFTRTPKTLILADWMTWTENETSERIKLFHRLRDEGFNLYLWIENNNEPPYLTNFDEKEFSFLKTNIAIQPYEQLFNLAKKQLHLRPDEIAILDNDSLKTILKSDSAPDTLLPLFSIIYLNSHYYEKKRLEEKIAIIRKNSPHLRGFYIHSFPCEIPPDRLDIVRSQLPNVEIAYNIAYFTLDSLKKLLEEGKFQQGSLVFNINSLSTISKLSLMKFSDNLDFSSYPTTDYNLNALTTLSLSKSSFSIQSLLNFIQKTPALKKLYIENSTLLGSLSPYLSHPNSLEHLYVLNGKIDAFALEILLRNSSKLKHLTLNNVSKSSTENFSTDIKLCELETFTLEYMDDDSDCPTMSFQQLEPLLRSAKPLKKLTLKYCTKLLFGQFSSDLDLTNLEELSLIGSPTNAVALRQLLKNTSRLKKLNLSSGGSLQNFFSDLELDTLEILELRNLTISIKTLEALLKKTKNVTLLDLSYSNISGNCFHADLSLNQLDSLFLQGSVTPAKRLEQLLKNSKKLKMLILGDLAGSFTDDLHLEQLETLNCQTGVISIDQLSQLLRGSKKIKTIYFPKNIHPNDIHLLPSLDSVKYVNFMLPTSRNPTDSITIEIINLILQKFPNIEKINTWSLSILLRQKKSSSSLFLDNHPSYPSLKPDLMLQPQERDAGLNFDTPTTNPTHQLAENLRTQTDYETSPFNYQGKNKSKNQGMIIEKLCQYLTVTKTKVAHIPKLRKGLCNLLSIIFLEKNYHDWHNWLTQIQSWNGESNTLTPELITLFEELIQSVEKYQFQQNAQIAYLGETLKQFLEKNPGKYQLRDAAWHAIAIRYDTEKQSWQFYDPNFIEGGEENLSLDMLLIKIQKSIGKQISISINEDNKGTLTSSAISISDPDKFIEEGGLFILAFALNSNLLQLPSAHFYSRDSLSQGLRLLDLDNTPAWVHGLLNTHTQSLTVTLLDQFISNEQDWVHKLDSSLNKISDINLLALDSVLSSMDSKISKAIMPLLTQRVHAIKIKSYEKLFSTWDTKPTTSNILAYYQTLLNSLDNTLIEFSDTLSLDQLAYGLQKYAISTSRPIFYVTSPDDLICSSPIININGHEGQLKEGPGGLLYDFLQENKEKNPIIIVNYQRFLPEDIVRFNTLLDPNPSVDGTPLPANTQIIGLSNTTHPNYYDGADFYSRFKTISSCIVKADPIPLLPPEAADMTLHQAIEIDLYESDNWKEILLGRWGINGDTLHFYPGALQSALEKLQSAPSPVIVLNHPPKRTPDFEQFWQDILLHHSIFYAGYTITLPHHLQFQQKECDQWPELTSHLTFLETTPENALIINQGKFQDLFVTYQHQKGKLYTNNGLLEENKEKIFSFELSCSLSKSQWRQLLSEAKKHRVQLHIYCSPGVNLPEEFKDKAITHNLLPLTSLTQITIEKTQLIESKDPALSISSFIHDSKDWIIIDVSECSFSDLYKSLHGKLDDLHFCFTESEHVLLTALKENKKIILTGHFSDELSDALAPLLLHRQRNTNSLGQLLLVGKNMEGFSYAQVYQHQITPTLLRNQLQMQFTADAVEKIMASNPSESYTQLSTRLTEMTTNDPWIGLRHLPTEITLPQLDFQTSEQESAKFIKRRQQQIDSILSKAPYVFLSGLTGVGKSTFVRTTFPNAFIGEDKIINWAEDNSPGRKILFIDEANLSHSQWSEFQGLFQRQPGILIHGHYYPLTPEHKVIFAGNPVNYGDERKLSPLFEQHGHALLFEPMPEAFLYENILNPVFENKGFSLIEIQTVSKKILTLYRFFCQNAKDEVAISPRELQMIALLIISAKTLHQEEPVETLADHYIQLIGQQLANVDLLSYFETSFQAATFTRSAPEKISNFILTDSRLPLYHQLIDLLALQKFRQNTKNNSAQRYGGLGGIIIEGDPGIGKSEFVLNFLVSQGFHEIHSDHSSVSNGFYRMPVSWGIDEKTKLLLKAFDEGSIVLIDEINSSPMMERLLNCLLMGTTPDGKRASNPGFMIIGTQNPPTMAGRRKPSTALSRRLMHCTLPNYRQDELIHILRTEGISPSKAELLSAAFIKQHAYAIKNNLSPAPTFRTLLREAKKINSSQVEPENKPLSLSPPDATNPPTPTENEINPQEKEAVLKLIGLCNSYKQHLEKTIGYKKSIDISTTKIQKINSLLETLKSNTSNKEKLSKFQKDLFEESTIQSLSLRRADKTTVSRKFLQACAAILGLLGLLPLGIAMLISKIATRSENNTGRFRFWNTSGQGLINDAGSILTKHNRSEKKKH